MKRIDKILCYGALSISIICFFLVASKAYAYTGSHVYIDLTQLQTLDQFIGWISSPYTDLIGPLFDGVLMLALTLPIYIRNRNIGYMMIVAFIVFGSMEIAIPAGGINYIRIIMVLGAGYLIYATYMSVKK